MAENNLTTNTSSTISESMEEVDAKDKPAPDLLPSSPEGGRQAWMTILGAFLVQYSTFGYVNAFGAYQDYYVRHYLTNYSPSSIGWIGGTQVFLSLSTGIFAGQAFDRDRGHFYKLIVGATLLHAISLFMLSLSHRNSFYQVFLTNGVGLGLSTGIIYVQSLGIPAHYFQRKRPLALGIVSAGSALGAVLHPIMLNKLFTSELGFHNSVRLSAGLNTILLLAACFLMRTRLHPKKGQRFPIHEWLKEPAYLLCLAAGIFMMLGLFYPLFYLQLSAIKHGVPADIAFYVVSIINVASIFGRIVPMIFTPRFCPLNIRVFFNVSVGIIICCMVLVMDVPSTIVFAIFYGFFSGAAIAIIPAVIWYFAKDVNELGARMGVNFVFSGAMGLIGVPISGALLTKQYNWLNTGLFAGISMVLSGTFFALSMYLLRKDNRRADSAA